MSIDIDLDRDTGAEARRTFDVHRPGTGEVLGTYPVDSAADVKEAVRRARAAAVWWVELGWAERRRRLDAFRGVLARRISQLAGLVSEETGKPSTDAVLEVALVLDHLAWAARNAEKVLGRRRVRSGLSTLHLAGSVEYKPYGVVGVIGPWNFPVFTPLGSVVFALAAGNAVVFKPSELTPGVGRWLVDAFAAVVPEQPVLQLVTGDGSTGAALCRSGVDKVAFTGSTATARQVMAACAETLTPLVAECGGKDALLVDEDADVDAAVDGALWAGLVNAGQACIATERIYVHAAVYDEFVQKLATQLATLRAGTDPDAQLGPITLPSQVDVIAAHVSDALGRGAHVLAGGGAADGQVVQPVLLTDVPEDAPANQAETFGPTLTVRKIADLEEGVRYANGTRYGLGAVVYGRRRAREVAPRLRAGMVSINAVFATAALPSVPFGGVGASGFGRVHGPDGLREFASPQAVARLRFPAPLVLTSFRRTAKAEQRMAALVALVHGRH
jgi:acyl-CoA reductase-like NAD-dependent aldehyde dehydrogenase